MDEIKKIANEAASILIENYLENRYSPLFTLPGVCYHWNSNTQNLFSEPIDSELNKLVPEIFSRARKNKTNIIKPKLYIPRPRDEPAHYSLLSMRNPSVLSEEFFGILDSNPEGLREIVNGTRLLTEAADAYIGEYQNSSIPKNTDFFNFLMHYSLEGEFKEERKPTGKFTSLLERLLVRFESSNNLFKSVSKILENEDLENIHYTALEERKPKTDKSLIEAHQKHVGKEKKVVELDSSTIQLSPRKVFGKTKVKVGIGSDGSHIDLQRYAERIRPLGEIRFDPNLILEQQLVDRIVKDSTESFRFDPEATIKKLTEQATITENTAEEQSLNKAIELFRYASSFDDSPRIHHTITITRKK